MTAAATRRIPWAITLALALALCALAWQRASGVDAACLRSIHIDILRGPNETDAAYNARWMAYARAACRH